VPLVRSQIKHTASLVWELSVRINAVLVGAIFLGMDRGVDVRGGLYDGEGVEELILICCHTCFLPNKVRKDLVDNVLHRSVGPATHYHHQKKSQPQPHYHHKDHSDTVIAETVTIMRYKSTKREGGGISAPSMHSKKGISA
jgi:hypothetical protein